MGSPEPPRLQEIQRTHRHATATRRTGTDSWLNGYQDDVAFLLERVNQLEKALDCGGVNCGECRACLATDLVLAYAALSGDAK